MKSVSVIVPVKEEQATVVPLVAAIDSVFGGALVDAATLQEIIFVDDGSRDGTWQEVQKLANSHPFVRGVRLRRNFGKAAALQEGIRYATGQIIITMDGDLQDDPKELPQFLAAIEAGADVVSGWKKVRHDPPGKTIPSRLFNWVTAAVTRVPIHDFNCGFKAYDREVLEDIRLYGELHRFVPAIAHSMGFRVSEIVVEHHPRKFGKSKYGIGRLLKGFLDLLTIVTITRFNSRPGHLFGGLGVLVGGLGWLTLLYLAILGFLGHATGEGTLLVISAILIMVGLQFVLFGMMAELVVSAQRRNTDAKIVSLVTGPAAPVKVIPVAEIAIADRCRRRDHC